MNVRCIAFHSLTSPKTMVAIDLSLQAPGSDCPISLISLLEDGL